VPKRPIDFYRVQIGRFEGQLMICISSPSNSSSTNLNHSVTLCEEWVDELSFWNVNTVPCTNVRKVALIIVKYQYIFLQLDYHWELLNLIFSLTIIPQNHYWATTWLWPWQHSFFFSDIMPITVKGVGTIQITFFCRKR